MQTKRNKALANALIWLHQLPLLLGHSVNYAHNSSSLCPPSCDYCAWASVSDGARHLLTEQIKFHIRNECGRSLPNFSESSVWERPYSLCAFIYVIVILRQETDGDSMNATSFSVRFRFVKHSFK